MTGRVLLLSPSCGLGSGSSATWRWWNGAFAEETTVLGVPYLTLRGNTERPITITDGTNRLVGWDLDRIVRATGKVIAVLPPPPRRPAVLDGRAGGG